MSGPVGLGAWDVIASKRQRESCVSGKGWGISEETSPKSCLPKSPGGHALLGRGWPGCAASVQAQAPAVLLWSCLSGPVT